MLTLTFYRSGLTRRWRWTLTAANGEKIAREAQARGFGRIADAEHNAALVLAGQGHAIVTDTRDVARIPTRADVTIAYPGREAV